MRLHVGAGETGLFLATEASVFGSKKRAESQFRPVPPSDAKTSNDERTPHPVCLSRSSLRGDKREKQRLQEEGKEAPMDVSTTEIALALQSVPYLLLITLTISRLLQRPIASFFSGLLVGVTSLAALLLTHAGAPGSAGAAYALATAATARLGLLGLLCACFVLFLLARHLTRIARWQQWGLSALLCCNVLLVAAPDALRLTALLFFLGACPLPFVFWRQSQHSVGAARRQVQWIGAALALLLAQLLLLACAELLPTDTAATSWASLVLFLLSGIALCLGFVPPRWLWNFWQAAERERNEQLFDQHLLNSPQPASGPQPERLAQMLEHVLQHAMQTLNCQAGVIERWNETANTFETLASASAEARISPRELLALKNGHLCEAFTEQRALAALLDTEQRFLPWGRSSLGALLAAPIVIGGKAQGVLGLVCERPPLFPDQHLALLQVFAQQVALWLVSAQPSATTQLMERLAQEQREKDEFIAVMVHELRSPLTVLKGRLQLLKRQLAKDNQTSVLEAITRLDQQFLRLEELIDTFVDVSYLDAGRFHLNKEPLDLAALVAGIAKRNRRHCAVHSLVLEEPETAQPDGSSADRPQPLWVMGDASRLTQVLQILFNQACQAASADTTITVRLRRAETGGEALVHISYQGASIPPEQQAQVFQRQVRSLTSPAGKTHGTGLELYISYETLHHHGGRLWVESSGVPGEGATFSFALPLLSPQEAALAVDLPPEQVPGRGIHDPDSKREHTHLSLPLRSTDQASDGKEQPHQEITSY